MIQVEYNVRAGEMARCYFLILFLLEDFMFSVKTVTMYPSLYSLKFRALFNVCLFVCFSFHYRITLEPSLLCLTLGKYITSVQADR